jgi:hypothetical protein
VEFRGVACAVTCNHVLEQFYAYRSRDGRYRFRIGAFECDPQERLRDSDEGLDLAILEVADIPAVLLRDDSHVQSHKPVRWPAEPVKIGDLVVLCGFPTSIRLVDVDRMNINSAALSLLEHVISVDTDSFQISLDRERWVSTANHQRAPEEIRNADFNGLSGSPVFSSLRDIRGEGTMEFVGVVLSEIPRFGGDEGLRVRSSCCIAPDGKLVR